MTSPRPSLAMVATKKFEGWFATSFWVDIHYGLAALGTLAVIVGFLWGHRFDLGFAGFVTGMWATAVGNDHFNLPPVGN